MTQMRPNQQNSSTVDEARRLMRAAHLGSVSAVVQLYLQTEDGRMEDPARDKTVLMDGSLSPTVSQRIQRNGQRLEREAKARFTSAVLGDPTIAEVLVAELVGLENGVAGSAQNTSAQLAALEPGGVGGLVGRMLRNRRARDLATLPEELSRLQKQARFMCTQAALVAAGELAADLVLFVRALAQQRETVQQWATSAAALVQAEAAEAEAWLTGGGDDLPLSTLPRLLSVWTADTDVAAIGAQALATVVLQDGSEEGVARRMADAVIRQTERETFLPADLASLVGKIFEAQGRDGMDALRRLIRRLEWRFEHAPEAGFRSPGLHRTFQVAPDAAHALLKTEEENLPTSLFHDPRPDRLGLLHISSHHALEDRQLFVQARDRLREAEHTRAFRIAWSPEEPPSDGRVEGFRPLKDGPLPDARGANGNNHLAAIPAES